MKMLIGLVTLVAGLNAQAYKISCDWSGTRTRFDSQDGKIYPYAKNIINFYNGADQVQIHLDRPITYLKNESYHATYYRYVVDATSGDITDGNNVTEWHTEVYGIVCINVLGGVK